jgi:hypothetical protein
MPIDQKTEIKLVIATKELPPLSTLQDIDGSRDAARFVINALHHFMPHAGMRSLFEIPDNLLASPFVDITLRGKAARTFERKRVDMKLDSAINLCWRAILDYMKHRTHSYSAHYIEPEEPEDYPPLSAVAQPRRLWLN